MSFKNKNYIVIKKAISPELANFVYKYFLLKRKVATTMFDSKFISPMTEYFGVWNDKQVPETFSHYGDIAMEILLTEVKPKMEQETKLKLIETYSYARLYKKGDILHKHKDRFSCEISTTLNLGGDLWSIYLEPNVKIDLEAGDMLVYKGNLLEHWRDAFKGTDCGQVFLHYNNIKTKGSKKNMYDRRPHLGLPSWFKK